ncbi:MAG: hypothetical protein OEM96_01925 [Gemmatimonadota bacterium]|nr:hypothetical protein [Gemmatimonadota bacterium]
MDPISEVRDIARDHLAVVRREFTRPWDEGSLQPGAETGRRLGLALTLSALVAGAGLALYSILGGD